jgi:hypothetical protein
LTPSLISNLYAWLQYHVGAAPGVHYGGARGPSMALFLKIPFAFYFFALGESIHPLTWSITIPAVLLIGYLAVRGLVYSPRAAPLVYTTAWTMLVLPVLLLFLVLDLLSPPDAGLAAPKYVSFGLYPFLGLITMGILAHQGGWRYVMAIGTGFAMVVGLVAYFHGGWNYNTHKLVKWSEAMGILKHWAGTETFLLADGRSGNELTYYLPDWPMARRAMLDDLSGEILRDKDSDVIVMAYPAPKNVSFFDHTLRLVQSGRMVTDGYYQNNLTLLRYSPLPMTVGDLPQAIIPCDVIDPRYLDLTLPQTVHAEGNVLRVVGGFSVDSSTDNRVRDISVVPGRKDPRCLLVVSNTTELPSAAEGTHVADIQVRCPDGLRQTLPIRLGAETGDWSSKSAPTAATVVHQWKKLAQLVGNERTATSWQQFEAHWYGAQIPLAHTGQPIGMEVHYRHKTGQLQIWALSFR